MKMIAKVYCKDCAAAEKHILEGYVSFNYNCHRKSGKPVEVPADHWCFEGIYVYGDKGVNNE